MNDLVVAVALSGGVDSLVSAYLLKKQFKQVFGIHFITGYEPVKLDVRMLENQLGINVHTVDLSAKFEQEVVQYLVNTYQNGKTPNPCLICNRKIKFGYLLDKALEFGADVMATGHYARIVNRHTLPDEQIKYPYLEKGKDPLKDQSYFLSMLTRRQLGRLIFPLAGMIKTDVKAIAASAGIAPVHSSESQDICFIQDNDLIGFMTRKFEFQPEPGEIVNIDGKIVGSHTGLHRFTIGQRRGINCPAQEPYYVKQIDMKTNRLVVCFKKDLTTGSFNIADVNWNDSRSGTIPGISTKIRYAHKGALSTLTLNDNYGTVTFNKPQNAVTPGQGAVFYQENRVLGAGIIQ